MKNLTKIIFILIILFAGTDASGQLAKEYFTRGFGKYKLQNYTGAIEDYTKAIGVDPDYYEAYLVRGFTKEIIQDYTGALEDYSKALQLKPDYSEAYLGRSLVRDQVSDFKGALSDLNKALEIDPVYYEAYYNRGLIKIKLHDYKQAIEDFDKALEINPSDDEVYLIRGFAKDKLKDYDGAIEDYNKAAEITPRNSKSYLGRGLAKIRLGQKESGYKDLEKSGYFDPRNAGELGLVLPAIDFKEQNFEDVVYLESDSIIHGLIVAQVPNKVMKIETSAGEIVHKSTKEAVNGSYLTPGFFRIYFEPGYHFGIGTYGLDRIILNIIFAKQVNQYMSLGLGSGLRVRPKDERVNTTIFAANEFGAIPVFANFTLSNAGKNISPFFSLDAGYCFSWGMFINPKVGFRKKISHRGSIDIGIGYEMQKMDIIVKSPESEWFDMNSTRLNAQNSGAVTISVKILP
jgi:tetratricopeptide (TPR) repeat protein